MTVRATWKGEVLAESDETVLLEGNHYFPPHTVKGEYLEPSDGRSSCPWKGVASYCDLVVGSDRNPGAAWYYPKPKEAAAQIADHVAFWNGVTVEELA